MLPIFIGAIKVTTVQHGGSFNIAGLGGILNTPAFNQKFQTGSLNNGDFCLNFPMTSIIDPDVIENPSSIIKGF
jgi:hypothetical protein